MKLRVFCPAKINTFLSVGPPGIGGYHPIRTVMQAIYLADELIVEKSDQFEITCNVALPEKNTLTKTLTLLNDIVSVPNLKITLTKVIPTEAGLGGGSSNAAGLIRAVSFMTGMPIDQHALDIASAVGKDVPFFLTGGRAKAHGLGDQIEPLEDEDMSWIVIAKPSEGVSSGGAYARLDEVERPFENFPEDLWCGYNDFMRIAPPACQDLASQLTALGADRAGLSGSGSAVWGRFASVDMASGAHKELLKITGLWAEYATTASRAGSQHLERLD